VTLIPIASFLAGSLLSLLIPALLLIALAVWYVLFLRRAPDAGPGRSAADAGTGNPGVATAPPQATGMGEGASGGGQPAL
jgi:hypothetical protein